MTEPSAKDVRGAMADANDAFRGVRIDGDLVTRPAHPGSATVHAFLRRLYARGLPVPEPLGLDEATETLRLVPGESGGRGWYHQHTQRGLRSAAELLRAMHDASAGWTPPDDAALVMPAVPGDDLVWCHGDPGPWNFVWRDDQAVGLIDWDYLHLAPRMDDVAYALRWFAPLRNDTATLEWHHFPAVPDRRARVEGFLAAYGPFAGDDEEVVAAVVARMGRTIDLMTDLAARDVEPQRTWVAQGAVDLEREEIRWIEQHIS